MAKEVRQEKKELVEHTDNLDKHQRIDDTLAKMVTPEERAAKEREDEENRKRQFDVKLKIGNMVAPKQNQILDKEQEEKV